MMESNVVELMGMVTGIIISLGFFAMFVLIIYYPTRARNKERMALIEKGVDVKDLYKKQQGSKNAFFKVGMITVGVALGLLFAVFISKLPGVPEPIAYFSMMLLFGGAGVLVGSYLTEKKQNG